MTDVKIGASADSATAAMTKTWKLRTQQFADRAAGRASVALGWSAPKEAITASTRQARSIRQNDDQITTGSVAGPAVAPQIVLGGVSLHARYPTIWDVTVYQSATVGSTFVGFALPEFTSIKDLIDEDFAKRTKQEMTNLQTSEACMIAAGDRIKDAVRRESDFMVELYAEVTSQIGLDLIVNSPLFATREIKWAGSLQHETVMTVTANFSGGGTETMTFPISLDPKILAEGQIATLQIIMIRRSDEWHMIATRTL